MPAATSGTAIEGPHPPPLRPRRQVQHPPRADKAASRAREHSQAPANMEGMTSTKRCVFCDVAGNRTKEHVIPLWLGSLLYRAQPPTGDSSSGKRFTHRFNPGPDDTSPPREWSTDEVDLVTNSVCEKCNNGWLHGLESEARPVLTRLVMGKRTDLSSTEQKTVATWSYKTALLFQLLRAENARPIPHGRFHELFVLRRPPAETRIWLGAARGNNAGRETSTEVNMVNVRHEVPGFFSALALARIFHQGEAPRVSRGAVSAA